MIKKNSEFFFQDQSCLELFFSAQNEMMVYKMLMVHYVILDLTQNPRLTKGHVHDCINLSYTKQLSVA